MQKPTLQTILISVLIIVALFAVFKFINQDEDKISSWQTYKSEEYGFEIEYSKDWTFNAMKYSEPDEGSPFVRFYPKSKIWIDNIVTAGGIFPVMIYIHEGSSQEYLSKIPQEKKEILINNIFAIEVINTVEGKTYQHLYVIDNPKNDNYIVISNQISALTTRLKKLFKTTEIPEEKEFNNIFNQMLSTFKFIE